MWPLVDSMCSPDAFFWFGLLRTRVSLRMRRALPALRLLSLLVTDGCGGGSAASSRDLTPTVRVTAPVVKKITEYVYFTGRTKAINSVDLQSRVTGYLQSIDFKPGDNVKETQ